jgi:hypothetical protein
MLARRFCQRVRRPSSLVFRAVRSACAKRYYSTPVKASDSEPHKSDAFPTSALSKVLQGTNAQDNNLLAPVHIPEDPHGIIRSTHPATKILANSAIVVQRQLEMMNLMLGFEQANKYVIMDPQGNHLGFMAEQEFGMGNMMARQWLRTHRSFTTHVFDKDMKEVLRFHRPFSWISSRIKVYDPLEVATSSYSSSTSLQPSSSESLMSFIDRPPQVSQLALADMRIIGEAQQQWAPLRRKYNLFLNRPFDYQEGATPRQLMPETADSTELRITSEEEPGQYNQFAYVDEPVLSWDFSLMSQNSELLGSVNRNFAGFGREIFTDTGVYALRMDSAGLTAEPKHLISKTGQAPTAYKEEANGMTLDQRAVMLATAVSIDFDYFSRARGGMFGGMFPMWMGGAGGEAAGAGAAGGVATEAGAGAVGGVARGAGGLGEGAAVGAGSMAGYEAMRGMSGRGDDASPQASDTQYPEQPLLNNFPPEQGEEIWGEDWNPPKEGQSSGGNQGGGEGGGDGEGFDISEWF